MDRFAFRYPSKNDGSDISLFAEGEAAHEKMNQDYSRLSR